MSGLIASFRQLVVPKEHGSWSLAFEPVALGLLVAPSTPGAVLALAIAAGFFVRRPLKLTCASASGDPRRLASAIWTMAFSVTALLALCLTAVCAGEATALWPLLLAVPCGAAFLWFDLRNDMREAEAELAGSAAFAVLPAAFATLAGWSAPAALGLAVLMLARSVPTVLTIRTYLRLNKRQPVSTAIAPTSAVGAWLLCTAFAIRDFVPPMALIVPTALALRTFLFVAPIRPMWSAKRTGMWEGGIGVLSLAVFALSYHLGWDGPS
jgi:hypothetical protein